jgi:RNA-binding protein YlmH
MNKQAMLKAFQTPEEKLLFSKLLDRLFLCQKTFQNTYSDFMDPSHAEKFMKALEGEAHEKMAAFGGAPGCERQMAGFAPEHGELSPLSFPISQAVISFNGKFNSSPSHRDFLGALMGLGIDRGKVGDILIEEGKATVFLHRDICGFVVENLEKVGKTGVSCCAKEYDAEGKALWEEWPELRSDDARPLDAVVSSLRVDSVVSAIFNIPRSKSLEKVQSGKVSVNWTISLNPAKHVSTGDMISARGLGRVRVTEILGETAKGKIRIRALKYS